MEVREKFEEPRLELLETKLNANEKPIREKKQDKLNAKEKVSFMNMKNHEFVVRIVQAAAEPKPPKREFVPVELVEEEEESLFQKVLGGVGVAAVVALGVFLVINFFSLGITVKEILVLVGIPLVLGIAASYTFF